MRYADWLRFRGDLFAIACLFFLWKEAYPAAITCGIMVALRNLQAAKIAANDFTRRAASAPDLSDRRKK